ncbi:exportin-2-like protein [Achlya hypogyna]|uniref:Exportin-2-like protein n=1 Tax=Achlya hypogyna TaxID=1202772 RepID=A0A1V9ZEA4_ACHHY|nr:exportin-2-like protein [Achlya hypogyna]
MAMNMGSPAELTALVGVLEKSLSPAAEPRRAAEASLKTVVSQPNGPLLLLSVLRATEVPTAIRLAAAIAFKNTIKEEWDPEGGKIHVECKNLVKEHIVGLMCEMPENLMKQLSAALFTIGEYDFPNQWPQLLPQIVEKLGDQRSDFRTINGVLETSNAIFKRFRHAFKSDALFLELKYCLEQFQAPLLVLFTSLAQRLPTTTELNDVRAILTALRTMARIFFSLNWQDLPEYFEDNIKPWMEAFEFLLKYTHPRIVDPTEEVEVDLLTLVHSAILDNITIYAEKYDEEFAPYLPSFTQTIWHYLSTTLTLFPKHDDVAAKSMKFLRSVALQGINNQLFEKEEVLAELCNSIVVRNLQLRESDVELFEDNPLEYIRKDIEGSDGDTRRSAATELLRGLRSKFEAAVTRICLQTITVLLQEYAASPATKWMQKDVAINLVTALAAVKQTRTRGVSEVHANVPLLEIFTGHVLPTLQTPDVTSPTSLLLIAGALKFVATFRNQLPAHLTQQLFPLLSNCLLPDQFVVHSYAAYCIEKTLTVKDGTERRFTKAMLQPYLAPLLNQVFQILVAPNYPENDYLMRMVLRLLVVAQDAIVPFADVCVQQLTLLLSQVCANPSNPAFSHCLFEALSMLINNVCKANPAFVETFEQLLFPPFQQVLMSDVEALCPYVYQVLAQLLDLSVAGALSPAYANLFPVLLSPALWERVSTVAAIVKLLETYLRKYPTAVAGHIQGVLGVFQKLISNRTTETQAFALLKPILVCLPLATYEPLLVEIVKILMMRLQTRLHGRNGALYVKEMLVTMSIFMAKHGTMRLVNAIEGCQAGMLAMILPIWMEHIARVTGADKKPAVVGLTLLVCDSPFKQDTNALRSLFPALATVLTEKENKASLIAVKTEDDILLDLEETGYDAGFSSLHFSSAAGTIDYLDFIPSHKRMFCESLGQLARATPGFYAKAASESLSPEQLQVWTSTFAAENIPFM